MKKAEGRIARGFLQSPAAARSWRIPPDRVTKDAFRRMIGGDPSQRIFAMLSLMSHCPSSCRLACQSPDCVAVLMYTSMPRLTKPAIPISGSIRRHTVEQWRFLSSNWDHTGFTEDWPGKSAGTQVRWFYGSSETTPVQLLVRVLAADHPTDIQAEQVRPTIKPIVLDSPERRPFWFGTTPAGSLGIWEFGD